MKKDALEIIHYAINQSKSDIALKKNIGNLHFSTGRLIVISIGKASWLMAKTISSLLSKPIDQGIVITKKGYDEGPIEGFTIYEASHPIVDESSLYATEKVLEATKGLQANDDVVFLLSGGGSALFELPEVTLDYMQSISQKLINCGADIIEINTIRKRLSKVKGGKFARWCAPAKVHNYILSDVISNQLDSIASGPTVEDVSTADQAMIINENYQLKIDPVLLKTESISTLDNVDSTIIGSADLLALAAKEKCSQLGYQSQIISTTITDNVDDFSKQIIELARKNQHPDTPKAFIFTGETTVHVLGNGLGGRNQHLCLLCIKEFANFSRTLFFSVGSDGSDGPTDAAGAIINQDSFSLAKSLNINIDDYLFNNDSYHCLEQIKSLIKTGPTGTNVNDLMVLLIR